MSELAPRALFFQGAPAIIPPVPPPEGHGLLWWIGVGLGVWFLISLVFGILIWPVICRWLGWPPTTLDEEAEALKRNEAERFFKKNQKRNKRQK